jgi:hypothetical protein
LEWSWYHQLDRQDLVERELLSLFGSEAGFTAKDYVDSLRCILELGASRLVLWFIILLALALLLGVLVKRWGVEGPSEVVALDRRVLGA